MFTELLNLLSGNIEISKDTTDVKIIDLTKRFESLKERIFFNFEELEDLKNYDSEISDILQKSEELEDFVDRFDHLMNYTEVSIFCEEFF